MKKRMLTMLLALVMILSALPFSAMAEETACLHKNTHIEKNDADCIHEGVVNIVCEDCDYVNSTKQPGFAPHAYGKDNICDVCGRVCKSHTYGSAVVVDATCTKEGTETKTCTECGTKSTKTLKATGHKFTVSVVGRVATCTVDGYSAHKTCEKCGEPNEEFKAIKAPGHKMITDKDTAATCTKNGTLEQHCEVEDCDYTYKETRKKLNHNYVPATGVKPTCTEDGFDDYEKCTRCGKQTEATPILALGHSYTTKVEAKPSTCTQSGYKAHSACSRCGKLKNFSSLPLAGHTYENGQCKICGAVAPNYSGTPAPGGSCTHTAVSTYRTDATCKAVGYIVKACDSCHVEISRDIIPATGHAPEAPTIKDPTCTEDGYAIVICGICNDLISNTTYAKYGHNYVNGICTRCGGSDSSKYTNDFQEVQIVGGTAY